jgi:phosphoglycerate dehydrogenase-like enzyme
MKIACLNDYQDVARSLADWASLGPDVEVRSFQHAFSSDDEAAEALAGFDVLCLMRERMTLSRHLIERLPALKLVTVTGSRFRCVDLEAAKNHGVVVCASGGGDASSTVEHAVALILAAAKRIAQEDRNLRRGGWQEGIPMLLEGRTLGLLGLGRLGTKVAAIGQALGMQAIAWSPNLTPERAAERHVIFASKREFFARSDIISIHLVLGPGTRSLVGPDELALMKPTSILVNTSRGPIIDEAALIAALRERRIGCAALDVFDIEPLPDDHPLKSLDNTVLTPHLGFVNDRSYDSYYRKAVEVIAAWRDGRPIGVAAA